jgi:hypothetical protein
MSFLKHLFKRKAPKPQGFVYFDFKHTYPHVLWSSGWGQDSEFPEGFRYKVFSVRLEPSGEFDVVLIQELKDGSKKEMLRWSVPSDKVDPSADVIQKLEEQFGVTFERVDMSNVRTCEEFEARARQVGWEVSYAD